MTQPDLSLEQRKWFDAASALVDGWRLTHL